MSDDIINGKPATTFWIIGGAALLWNLFGLLMYVMTVTATPETYASSDYTPEQIDFIMSIPTSATSAFAIAVNAGVLASLLLLFRKSWAVPMFILSLAALFVLDVYNFILRDTYGMFGLREALTQSVILLIGVLLVLYARYAKRKAWLT